MAQDRIFEEAARAKLRFPVRGLCSTEDLYDLPDDELEDLFRRLNKQADSQGGERLFVKRSRKNKILDLMIAIVKRVAETLVAEREARENAVANKARKDRLLAVKADKQDEALRELSPEELDEKIAELEKA